MVFRIIIYTFASHLTKGTLADRLGNGLQNRVEQFDSARYLKTKSSHSISDGCFSFFPLHEARRHPRAVLATFLNARSWPAKAKTVRECICRSTASTKLLRNVFAVGLQEPKQIFLRSQLNCKRKNKYFSACRRTASNKTKPAKQNIGAKDWFPTQLLLPLHTAIQAPSHWPAPLKGCA